MDELCEKLLKEVARTYSENGKITDDLLSALNCIFHGTLLSALELVDKTSVTKYTSPSGRTLFQIIGASGAPYLCFANVNYCSCPAYNFSDLQFQCIPGLIKICILKKEEHIMCKHVLAMKLSEAIGQCKKLDVTNEEMTSLILAME